MLLHNPASKTNPKLVRTHSASIWCWDKPRATLDSLDSPQPRLGGSHHLPPYSILCVTPREPHPNGTFPEIPEEESRNCPELDSRDFGYSYLPAPTSNWSEV